AVIAAIQPLVPGADIRIEEMNRYPVPDGKIIFALSSLPRPPADNPDEPVVWRGSIEYAPGRKFTIWVKARVSIATPEVLAIREIPADHELSAADVEIRPVRRFPSAQRMAERLDEVVGRKTMKAFRTGSPIPIGGLRAGNETAASKTSVVRGDSVKVTVESGLTHLVLDARAESAAVEGGMVKLRNPKSGKVFEARVTGKSSAVVVAQAASQ
ncbi:MAG: flagellar basal body P-ring formation chaperone FlgA, partial [Acidobacteriota bacterium]|nr:flagellar basal body P-ring formation chaperone FlgA [Acidobacteriota bacterium]